MAGTPTHAAIWRGENYLGRATHTVVLDASLISAPQPVLEDPMSWCGEGVLHVTLTDEQAVLSRGRFGVELVPLSGE